MNLKLKEIVLVDILRFIKEKTDELKKNTGCDIKGQITINTEREINVMGGLNYFKKGDELPDLKELDN